MFRFAASEGPNCQLTFNDDGMTYFHPKRHLMESSLNTSSPGWPADIEASMLVEDLEPGLKEAMEPFV